MNKTWRKQVGETGNLKKQKWRGMELGKKKQSFSSPAHSPSLSKRPTCQLHALKTEEQCATQEHMDGNAVFEMFHYSENIRKQKQLMGKKPSIFKTLSLVSAKNRVKGKSDYF